MTDFHYFYCHTIFILLLLWYQNTLLFIFQLDSTVADRIQYDNETLSVGAQRRQPVTDYDSPWSTVSDRPPQINSFDEFAAGLQNCSLNSNSRELDFFYIS
jgi:hypothetical protein